MAKTAQQPDAEQSVHLKDAELAAFLAWLIPGLGHLYQRRTAKAALFFVCIMGMFVYGLFLGSRSDLGVGRAVYFWWGKDYKRLPYLCQVGVGLPALPALVQSIRMYNGKRVWLGGFMAPPRQSAAPAENDPNADQPTLSNLNYELARDYELGTVFTMVAGLLNVLAIYDAWGGPVFSETAKKDEESEAADEAKTPDSSPQPST